MVEHIDGDQFRTGFSAFRKTLTSLSLDTFATSFSAFVNLVDYFPNVTTLQSFSPVLEPDEGPAPSLSRPLRGKLYVYETNCFEFLDRLAKLDLEYEELVFDAPYIFTDARFLESALQISTSTVKILRLTTKFQRE
jgi:hypothetical protein